MATVRLTWNDNNSASSQEDGFRIYRSLTPIDPNALPAPLVELGADAVLYDDTSAPLGQVYYVVGTFIGDVERVAPQESIILVSGVVVYRYWRILVTANQGDVSGRFSASEIELRDAFGGVDLTVSVDAVASASSKSQFGNNSANLAFDDLHSSGTWFTSNGSVYVDGGEWICWDFGAGNETSIVEVGIRGIHTQLELMPLDFVVQHSDDAITWGDAWSETGTPVWGASELQLFSQ